MQWPFELLSFVARSSNRLMTLWALADTLARRADILAQTDVPRATLSRILADIRDRDIVESGSWFEGVISTAVLDVVVASDSELVEPLRELLATGQAELFIYDADIETQFIIADGEVLSRKRRRRHRPGDRRDRRVGDPELGPGPVRPVP